MLKLLGNREQHINNSSGCHPSEHEFAGVMAVTIGSFCSASKCSSCLGSICCADRTLKCIHHQDTILCTVSHFLSVFCALICEAYFSPLWFQVADLLFLYQFICI
jgi:hypothetical protein